MCIPDPGYSAGSKGIVMVLSALCLALAAQEKHVVLVMSICMPTGS